MELKHKIEILYFIGKEKTTKRIVSDEFIKADNTKPYDYKDIFTFIDECKESGIINFDLERGNNFTGEILVDDKILLTHKGKGVLKVLKSENNWFLKNDYTNLKWIATALFSLIGLIISIYSLRK